MMGAAAPIGEFGSGQGQSDRLRRANFPGREDDTRVPTERRKRAFTDAADLRAVNSDIGKRVVVERHQPVIGPFPAPPIGKGLPAELKRLKTDMSYTPCCLMLHCTRFGVRSAAMPVTLLQSSHA